MIKSTRTSPRSNTLNDQEPSVVKRLQQSRTFARIKPIVYSLIVAVVFLSALYFFPNTTTINPTSEGLILFLVLLVGYLIFSGKLSEIGGAGFVLRLREISEANVAIEEFSNLPVSELIAAAQTVPKGPVDVLKQNILPRLVGERITTLSVKEGDPVERFALASHLEYMTASPYFRDVIFVDDKGRFKGRIGPENLLKLLNFWENSTPLIKAINERRIADIPGVSTHYVSINATNREALREMVREDVDMLSVLDLEGRFVGVVQRDHILASPLVRLIAEGR